VNTKGFVVPASGGSVVNTGPGRFEMLKLLREETGDSIMLFEETAPAGTVSTTLHLHHDSDEIIYVLHGEITFKVGDDVTVGGPGVCAFIPRGVAHAWKNTGADTARMLFLYTPGRAGGFFEELAVRPIVSFNGPEANDMRQSHGWEIVGPPPL
jgi:quercetin dioxygenase-like cupin family protein